MKLKFFLETGEKTMKTQRALAKYLEQDDSVLRAAKAGKRGLPDYTCIKLADLIDAPRLEVIAASNLATEKNEERRKLFETCFSKAAGIILTVGAFSMATPSPVEAAPILDVTNNQLEEEKHTVYYVKLYKN
jgi:hypothetical protein